MALTDEDIREILRIIDESALDELRIETEGFSLHVRRGRATETATSPPAPLPPPPRASTSATASPPAPAAAAAQPEDGLITVQSPMLGTFYRAEGPGRDPFVQVGSRVQPDTTVGIIEVMKMMNSVPAGVAGTIAEVCHSNGELVEYGAPLFRVEPAA